MRAVVDTCGVLPAGAGNEAIDALDAAQKALRDAIEKIRGQVVVANKYADDAKPRELRGIPGVWEIQNSHFSDVARDLEAALARLEGK